MTLSEVIAALSNPDSNSRSIVIRIVADLADRLPSIFTGAEMKEVIIKSFEETSDYSEKSRRFVAAFDNTFDNMWEGGDSLWRLQYDGDTVIGFARVMN
jgi:hypothetical protein